MKISTRTFLKTFVIATLSLVPANKAFAKACALKAMGDFQKSTGSLLALKYYAKSDAHCMNLCGLEGPQHLARGRNSVCTFDGQTIAIYYYELNGSQVRRHSVPLVRTNSCVVNFFNDRGTVALRGDQDITRMNNATAEQCNEFCDNYGAVNSGTKTTACIYEGRIIKEYSKGKISKEYTY